MALNITTYRLPDALPGKVEKGAVAIIKEELAAVQADGDFLATAKEQITVRANVKFKYVRFDNGQLIVKVKPGDNSTAWTWHITPPSGEHGEQLDRRLSGEPALDEVLAAAIPPAGTAAVAAPEAPPEAPPDEIEVEPEPAPVAPAEPGSIEAKYIAVEKAAQPYQARLGRIDALRKEIQIMFDTIEQKEAEVKRLEVESEKDAAGKDAFEKLHRIQQLLEL